MSLSSFTGSNKQHTNYLHWETSSETDNARFVVQSSRNGRTFRKIGTVKGNGTSLKARSYSFRDPHPFAGTTYYRLKQVDFDGTYKFSSILAIDQLAGEAQVQVFLNPAADQITVYSPVSLDISRIYITDLTGKTVKETAVSGRRSNITLSIQDLKPGVYLLHTQGPQAFSRQKIQKK